MRTIDLRGLVELDAISLSTSTEAAKIAASTLLTMRAPDATICLSEAARLIARPEGVWRNAMRQVHTLVDELHRDGAIKLSWQDKTLRFRVGPYRIGRH